MTPSMFRGMQSKRLPLGGLLLLYLIAPKRWGREESNED